MTEDRMAYWAKYIRLIANKLHLREWTITLSSETTEDAHSGSIGTVYGRRQAFMFLNSDFDTWKPQEQRHTITHELVHLHHTITSDMVEALNDNMKVGEYQLFLREYNRHTEYMVDLLADSIAPLMPLPELPKESEQKDEDSNNTAGADNDSVASG